MLAFEVVFEADGPEDLLIRAAGRAESGEFERLYDELTVDPRFRSGLRILADYREVDVTGLTKDDITSIAKVVRGHEPAWGAARFAIVVPNALGYGFIRMADFTAGLQQVTVLPAYTLEEARAWLQVE